MTQPQLLSRQLVFDRRGAVIGAEVLTPAVAEGDATRRAAAALLDAFAAGELDDLAHDRAVYTTLPGELLARFDLLPVEPSRVVIQLDLGRPLTDDALAAVQRLAGMGYAFAAVGAATPAAVMDVGVVRTVRVSLAGTAPERVEALIAPWRDAGLDVHAVAVADGDTLAAALDAGCCGVQGAVWCLPRAQGNGVPAGLPRLLDPNATLEQLTAAIAEDLALTYALLRYINSAFFSRASRVETVPQAAALLGERMLRRWATIVVLAGTESPGALGVLLDALLRARMLEHVAPGAGLDRDRAYAVGLLSLLPALVGQPPEELYPALQLGPDLSAALLRQGGPYGLALTDVAAYIDGDFSGPEQFDPFTLREAFGHARAEVAPLARELLGAAVPA